MSTDPSRLGGFALNQAGVHMPAFQDGVQFEVDGIRHTVNSASNPAYHGLAYHSQANLATGAHQTNIIGPDGSVVR